jgi:hypothetical protein
MKAIGLLSLGEYQPFTKEAGFSNRNGFHHDGF